MCPEPWSLQRNRSNAIGQMSAIRSVAITAVGNFVPAVAMLANQVLLAQGLGVIGRGEVAAATAPLLFAAVVFSLSLPETLTFFVARTGGTRAMRQLGFSLIVLAASGTVGFLLITLVAQPFSGGSEELAELMILAASALVPALFKGALRGIAFGAQQWWLVTAEKSLSAFAQVVSLAVLFALDLVTPRFAVLTIAAGTFIGAAVYLFSPAWWRVLGRPIRNDLRPTDRPLPKFSAYAWQSWIGSVSGIMLIQLDQVLMTPLAGVEELGVYAVGANIASAALLFNSAVGQVVFSLESSAPSLARVGRAARMTTIATALFGACLAVPSPWIVPLVFGPEFKRSVPVALILLAEICLAIPGSVAGTVLSAHGRPGLRSLALTLSAVVYVITMVVMVPRYGATGAALAMAAATMLPGYLCIYFLCSSFGVRLSEFYHFRRSDLPFARMRRT